MNLRLVFGIAILLILFIMYRDSLLYLKNVNILYFGLSVFFYIMLNILLAYRIFYLMKKSGKNAGFSKILKAHFAGMILGDITPGRAGYFSSAVFAGSYGIDSKAFMGVILSSQAVELIVKIFASSIAVVYFIGLSELYLLAFPLLATILAIVYLWTDLPPKIGRLEEVRVHARKTSSHAIFIALISIAGWFLTALQWYFVFISLKISAGIIDALFAQPLATLLMFVPLTPAGIGVFESGSALIVSRITSDFELALAFSVMVRLSTTLADLPGVLVILRKKKS